MSPKFPGFVGIVLEMVYSRAIFSEPLIKIDEVSIPSSEYDVNLLLITTGPLKVDRISLFSPPSTRKDSEAIIF